MGLSSGMKPVSTRKCCKLGVLRQQSGAPDSSFNDGLFATRRGEARLRLSGLQYGDDGMWRVEREVLQSLCFFELGSFISPSEELCREQVALPNRNVCAECYSQNV